MASVVRIVPDNPFQSKCSLCFHAVDTYWFNVSHPPGARQSRVEIEQSAARGCIKCKLLLHGVEYIERTCLGAAGTAIERVIIFGYRWNSVMFNIQQIRSRAGISDCSGDAKYTLEFSSDAAGKSSWATVLWQCSARLPSFTGAALLIQFWVYNQHISFFLVRLAKRSIEPAMDFIEARIGIADYPLGEEPWSKAYGWFSTCINTHALCDQTTQGHDHRAPKRMVYIGDSRGQRPRIIDWDQSIARRYATLSYCWGSERLPLRTTTENLTEMMKGIRDDSLPQNFLDAMLVAQKLGLQHIWIDSLCIIQDSPDDWADESSKMSSIYESSIITIVVASTQDSHVGFLGPRLGSGTTINLVSDEGDLGAVRLRLALDHNWFLGSMGRLLNPATAVPFPWNTRAWCLQERLLARRILYFTAQEMLYECRVLTDCECGQGSKTYPQGIDGTQYPALLNIQQRDADITQAPWPLLSYYSSKLLSFEEDKLPAFSGVAARLSSIYGEYYAGLWRSNLLNGLVWAATNYQDSRGKTYNTRPKGFVAPSFSWASVMGSVGQTAQLTGNITNKAEIVDIECKPLGSDPYSKVLSGRLVLRTALIEGTFQHDAKYGSCSFRKHMLSNEGRGRIGISVKLDVHGEAAELNGETMYALRLLTYDLYEDLAGLEDDYDSEIGPDLDMDEYQSTVCLMLVAVSGSTGHYRRIGISTEAPHYWFPSGRSNHVLVTIV